MQTSLGAGTKHGGGFYVDISDSASLNPVASPGFFSVVYDPVVGPGFFYMVWSIFLKKSKEPAVS